MTEYNRMRLLADRMCYLVEGDDGLRYRAGMIRAFGKDWRDEYDIAALDYMEQETK